MSRAYVCMFNFYLFLTALGLSLLHAGSSTSIAACRVFSCSGQELLAVWHDKVFGGSTWDLLPDQGLNTGPRPEVGVESCWTYQGSPYLHFFIPGNGNSYVT